MTGTLQTLIIIWVSSNPRNYVHVCRFSVSRFPVSKFKSVGVIVSLALFRCLVGQRRWPGANYLKFGIVRYQLIMGAILFQCLCTMRRADMFFFCAPYSLVRLHWFVSVLSFVICTVQPRGGGHEREISNAGR